MADTTNFLRIMNFPIFTLSFLTFYEQGKDVRKKHLLGLRYQFYGGCAVYSASLGAGASGLHL